MTAIPNTDLLINPDGSIYHLNLHPEQLADTIIVVGDPDRVPEVSHYFDGIEFTSRNREFVAHTGYCKGKRITVLATGIGTDNIDIVVNELDALANIDLKTRLPKPVQRSLDIIRIGTSGAIQPGIPVNTFALSLYGLGFDNLIHFYHPGHPIFETSMEEAFLKQVEWNPLLSRPYIIRGSEGLLQKFEDIPVKGITATAPGFYGPQGRSIRLAPADPQMLAKIRDFQYQGLSIINFEMETSALYGLSRMLGHHAATVCAMIANRATQEYSPDHKPVIRRLIEYVVEKLTT